MTKGRIGSELYHMKKEGEEVVEIGGELYSADELLTMLLGQEIEEAEGQEFVRPSFAGKL